MEEDVIVAILSRSDGNDSIGEMWEETGIFDYQTPVVEIIEWAIRKKYSWRKENFPAADTFRGNLRLTVSKKEPLK